MGADSGRVNPLLRGVLLVDGAIFLVAALLNWGFQVPLGFVTLAFAPAVWQAGVGEAVVGCTLVLAATTARRRIAWTGFWLSAVGIAFGLSSHAVQGAARQVHVVLVPLAVVLLLLLLASGEREVATRAEGHST